MREETVRHLLGVAVRVDNHFSAVPVADELVVRVDTAAPTTVRGGSAHRHADGTYRFLDIDDGAHHVAVRSPDDRWMTLDPDPIVVTPMAQPTRPLVIEAWPTPVQATPLGMTSIRGKLLGSPASTIARRIEFDAGGADTQHRTQSSSAAEFLFLLPGNLRLDADGFVPLALRVQGGVVTGGEIVAGEQITPFIGSSFRVVPARETRVRFHVT